jgi:hypothetical protein
MHRARLLLITATAIALTASSARATMLITADPGGLIIDYAERFLTARATALANTGPTEAQSPV